MSADPQTESPGGGTKFCSTCFEPINARARKCKTCDSYQDWRRHVSLGSSVLALLVALVSVIALAAPAILNMITPEDSEIRITFQGVAGNRIFLMAANSGNRAGTVTQVRLGYQERDGRLPIEFQPVLIEPGAAKQIAINLDGRPRMVLDREFVAGWTDQERGGSLEVFVNYAEFSGRYTPEVVLHPGTVDTFAAGNTPWHRCVASLVGTVANSDDPNSEIVWDLTWDMVRRRCRYPIPLYLRDLAPRSGTS